MEARTKEPFSQAEKDADLEARIFVAYCQAITHQTSARWKRVAELIKRRSPYQVAAMERERGLA
jgi:hypothetical protein